MAALTCGFWSRGGIRTVDLPITSRNGFVQHMPSRPVLAAHVSVPVCCIRSNPAALRQVEWPASQRQDYQTVATFRFRSEIGAPENPPPDRRPVTPQGSFRPKSEGTSSGLPRVGPTLVGRLTCRVRVTCSGLS